VRKFTRVAVTAAALLAVAVAGTACSEIAPPDQVGLYYMEGQSDGYKFGHCVEPGSSDDWLANNSIVWLPTNLRTWNIAAKGGDTDKPVTVQSAPEKDQPSGVQVNVWSQTNFMLNTSCASGKDSPAVQWWERIGRRYAADTDEGWKNMLYATVVPALETALRNVVRGYNADPLVAGTVLADVQTKVSDAFQVELKRLVGADFFCGPTFDRASGKCPPVQVLVKDVDYTDPGIQAARNEKQAAIEKAAAAVAEAEGKVRAAAAQSALYQNQAWIELEKAKIELAKVEACAKNPNCTIILGSSGGTIVQAK